MKIAVRGGHNFSVRGASAIIDETVEDRKVKNAVIKYLKQMGHNVLDVTAPDSCNTVSSDLSYGVNKANNWGAELFISIHFNKAYSSYNGRIGTEVLVYSNRSKNTEAKRVVNKLDSLGFKNRGIKQRPELYELRATKMNAFLVEVCFVEATEDVKLYRKLGADTIGHAIAEGAVNSSISSKPTPSKPSKPTPSKPSSSIGSKSQWVYELQKELNRNYGGKLILDGIPGPKTLAACPLVREGARGNLVKIIQKKLISLGYNCGGFGADGHFGNGTEKSVKDFQRAKKISSDGIIGNNTWRKLLGI